MDKYRSSLDFTFAALAHETRRQMLQELGKETVRVTDLAARFGCALPVASKHIRVLERAGLVQRERCGREHRLRFNTAPLAEASAFIERYRARWEEQLDQLGRYLDKMADEEAESGPQKP